MKKLIATLLTVVMVAGIAAGCSTTTGENSSTPTPSASSSPTSSASATPEASVPQEFTFAGTNDIMTLDVSQMNDEMSALIMYAVNEGLIRYSNDQIIPGIAEEHTVSEDGKVYTFKLRDAVWSDGVAVTAADFEYSFLRTLNPATGSSQVEVFDSILNARAYYSGELTDAAKVGIKAEDDKTLVITLAEADPFFLSHMAQSINFYPIRKDLAEKSGANYGSSPDAFIGCGPFVLKEWVQGASLTMEKNASYWDASSIKLDKVVELIVPDENTRVGMYDLGEIDGVYSISKAQTVKYTDYGSKSGGTLQHLVFNSAKGKVMDNVNLRKALSFAIDRGAIVQAISAPGTTVADRMIDPTIMLDGTSVAGQYPNTTGIPVNGDVDKAKEYLNAALAELGLTSVSQLPAINYVCLDSATHKQYAEALQARWQEVLEVKVDINILPVPQAIGSLLGGEFDIFLNGQGTGVKPDTLLTNYTVGNGNNYAKWDNEEYSALIEAERTSASLKEGLEALQKAEALILDQAPVAPLWLPGTAYLVQDYVKDLHYGRQTGSIEFIYSSIEK